MLNEVDIVARSDAEFDGRDFDKLSRTDRERYIARAFQSMQRLKAARWMAIPELREAVRADHIRIRALIKKDNPNG